MKLNVSDTYQNLLDSPTVPVEAQRRILQYAKSEKKSVLMRKLMLLENLDPEVEKELLKSKYEQVHAAWLDRPGRSSEDINSLIGEKTGVAILNKASSLPGLSEESVKKIFANPKSKAETLLKLHFNPDVTLSSEQEEEMLSRLNQLSISHYGPQLKKLLQEKPSAVKEIIKQDLTAQAAYALASYQAYTPEVNLELFKKALEAEKGNAHRALMWLKQYPAFKTICLQMLRSEHLEEAYIKLGLDVNGFIFAKTPKNIKAGKLTSSNAWVKQLYSSDDTSEIFFAKGMTSQTALKLLKDGNVITSILIGEMFSARWPQQTQDLIEMYRLIQPNLYGQSSEGFLEHCDEPEKVLEGMFACLREEYTHKGKSYGLPRYRLIEHVNRLSQNPIFKKHMLFQAPMLILNAKELDKNLKTIIGEVLVERFEGKTSAWEIFESLLGDERNHYQSIETMISIAENI